MTLNSTKSGITQFSHEYLYILCLVFPEPQGFHRGTLSMVDNYQPRKALALPNLRQSALAQKLNLILEDYGSVNSWIL